MLDQGAQHANGSPPDRHRVGAPEQDLGRDIKAKGPELVDCIHAGSERDLAPFWKFLGSVSRHLSLVAPSSARAEMFRFGFHWQWRLRGFNDETRFISSSWNRFF